jgi:hypothetical protein
MRPGFRGIKHFLADFSRKLIRRTHAVSSSSFSVTALREIRVFPQSENLSAAALRIPRFLVLSRYS